MRLLVIVVNRSKSTALVLALLAACSFAQVRGPSNSRQPCTDDYGAPVVDTVLSALAFYGGWLASHAEGKFSDGVRVGGTALIVTGGAYGISAATGYAHVAACRDHNALTGSASGIC